MAHGIATDLRAGIELANASSSALDPGYFADQLAIDAVGIGLVFARASGNGSDMVDAIFRANRLAEALCGALDGADHPTRSRDLAEKLADTLNAASAVYYDLGASTQNAGAFERLDWAAATIYGLTALLAPLSTDDDSATGAAAQRVGLDPVDDERTEFEQLWGLVERASDSGGTRPVP